MDDEDSTSRQQDERPEDGGNYEDGVDDDVDVAFAKDTKLEQYLNTLDEYTTIRNDANEQLIKVINSLSLLYFILLIFIYVLFKPHRLL